LQTVYTFLVGIVVVLLKFGLEPWLTPTQQKSYVLIIKYVFGATWLISMIVIMVLIIIGSWSLIKQLKPENCEMLALSKEMKGVFAIVTFTIFTINFLIVI